MAAKALSASFILLLYMLAHSLTASSHTPVTHLLTANPQGVSQNLFINSSVGFLFNQALNLLALVDIHSAILLHTQLKSLFIALMVQATHHFIHSFVYSVSFCEVFTTQGINNFSNIGFATHHQIVHTACSVNVGNLHSLVAVYIGVACAPKESHLKILGNIQGALVKMLFIGINPVVVKSPQNLLTHFCSSVNHFVSQALVISSHSCFVFLARSIQPL